MITGDSPLTACEVARELKMTDKPTLILQRDHTNPNHMFWLSIDEDFRQDFKLPVPKDLVDKYDFCITGETLTEVLANPKADEIIKHTVVYARTSPEQKVRAFSSLKSKSS
jgi:cation-transporting ATPase 13A1